MFSLQFERSLALFVKEFPLNSGQSLCLNHYSLINRSKCVTWNKLLETTITRNQFSHELAVSFIENLLEIVE